MNHDPSHSSPREIIRSTSVVLGAAAALAVLGSVEHTDSALAYEPVAGSSADGGMSSPNLLLAADSGRSPMTFSDLSVDPQLAQESSQDTGSSNDGTASDGSANQSPIRNDSPAQSTPELTRTQKVELPVAVTPAVTPKVLPVPTRSASVTLPVGTDPHLDKSTLPKDTSPPSAPAPEPNPSGTPPSTPAPGSSEANPGNSKTTTSAPPATTGPNPDGAPPATPVDPKQTILHDHHWTTPVDPKNYSCSSKYEMRWGSMHWGDDLAAPDGTVIRAAHDGTIEYAGKATGFGHWVVEKAGDLHIIDGHMREDEILVTPGQQVVEGQPIAKVGSDGQATGPHDHFEIRVGSASVKAQRLNPEDVMKDNGIDLCQ